MWPTVGYTFYLLSFSPSIAYLMEHLRVILTLKHFKLLKLEKSRIYLEIIKKFVGRFIQDR